MSKKLFSRSGATKIDNIGGFSQILIDLKPNRSVSDVYINQKMDVTNLCKYVEKCKNDGMNITYFHVFVAAIGKLLYNRNKMNRFVQNRHIYEHNSVVVSFAAKIALDDNSEEVMVLVDIDPNDNLESISKKIKDKIDAIRNSKNVSKKGANSAIDTLGKLPNIIRVPIVGLFKWCDRKGILPASLVQDNIYYSSIIVSNLGSIKCGAIFHNINDFGECSSLLTIGEIKDEYSLNKDGKVESRKVCEFGINLDERIADGYYFAKSLEMLQYIFDNPSVLGDDMSDRIDIKKD